jgi:hypothetical protein
MNRIFTLLIFALLTKISAGQIIYQQDFSSGVMPPNFTLFNLDGLTPDDPDLVNMTDSAWTIKNITAQGFTGGYGAFSVSWYVNDAGPSNDWMILPAIELGSDPYLSWTAMAITSSGLYRDQYQVFVSPGGGTIEDYILLSPIFDTGSLGEIDEPTDRSVSLSEFANQTVFIAFRNTTQPYNPDGGSGPGNGGNELVVDDIIVSQGPLNVQEGEQESAISIYPNPAQGNELNIQLNNSETAIIEVISTNGQIVARENSIKGSNVHTLSIENFANGTYTVRVVQNSKVMTSSVVVAK